MTILRHEKPEEYEVEIHKKAGKGAGICFRAFSHTLGVYVSELVSSFPNSIGTSDTWLLVFYQFTSPQTPGGQAAETRKMCLGDHLLALNGMDVREVHIDDIAFNIKLLDPLKLKLARYTSAKK